MKLKRNFLIILLLIIIFNLIFAFDVIPNSFADDSNFDFEQFDDKNSVTGSEGVKNLVNESSGIVITVVRMVCVCISMVMLLVISMKYMMASPGDRADIKKHSINFVIGAFILFGLNFIIGVIGAFSEQIK